jgi:hypothetical protein
MKQIFCGLLIFLCIMTQGCEKTNNQETANNSMESFSETEPARTETDAHWNVEETVDIQQQIADYRMRFIEQYSTSALDASNPQMKIEAFEAALGDSADMATVVKYSDTNNRCLRYRAELYGETMNVVVNYYFCDDFTWISKQSNYYSSWTATAGWDDVLYSELTEWIVCGNQTYLFSDNGQIVEIENEQLAQEVPSVSEVARCCIK